MSREEDDKNSRPASEVPEAPARLVAALKEMYGDGVEVLAAIDAAVGDATRRRLTRARRRHVAVQALGAAAAAAAAVIVFWALTTPVQRAPARRVPRPVAQALPETPADYDGNGRVDIRDAFALARRIESGPAPDARWDLNHDGAVDRRDADLIGMQAVQLRRGRAQ